MRVTIEKLIYGGEGLAHHDGHTIFVPFVLPGEETEVETVEQKKKFIRGRAQKVLTASAERIAPVCRHFADCGGCHYQHIPYEAQLRYKTEILRETLGRIGRVSWEGPIPAHASPPWGYRNRAQWKVRPLTRTDAASNATPRLGIGYFCAGSTALCTVEECPILSPRLAETLAVLREVVASGEMPATLREVEAFADAADARILLNASFAGLHASAAVLVSKFRTSLPWLESVLLIDTTRDRMDLDGPGYLRTEVSGTCFRVGHMSFFQVNRFLVEELARAVADGDGGMLALDLFAGVGLFAAALAPKFERVIAVEANPASARDLVENLGPVSSHAEARETDVDAFLHSWKETPDLAVIDPPRAGMSPAALARLTKLAPPRIVYVSCDPSTLARDLAALAATGYSIEELHLFDLFPETFHIESLVRLTRRS
jgi:23S rRNA (uracil1939-C5)-methyltransferase